MGNDGGSIPTRRELVKEAARDPNLTAIKEKQKEHLAHLWTQCPISLTALHKPVVADYAGNLYNKDAILQYLLPSNVSPLDKPAAERFIQGRVKSLKDIVEVLFEVEQDSEIGVERWICPVTSKELGPNTQAVFLVPCGHAFSKGAIDVMKDITSCPSCGTAFDSRDVVPVFPTSEAAKSSTVERLKNLTALGLTHSLKKAPGRRKRKAPENLGEDSTPSGGNAEMTTVASDKNIPPTATPRSHVHGEQATKKRTRPHAAGNEPLKSPHGKSGTQVRDGDFMTRGFSIPSGASRR